MAIALRSLTTATSGTGTVVVDKPSGVVDGDFLLTTISLLSDTLTMDTLSGWTPVPNCSQVVAGGGADIRTQSFYKIASGEGASWTWSVGGGTSVAKSALCSAWTGVDAAAPIDISNGQGNASSTNIVAPSVDPAFAGMLVNVSCTHVETTITPPSGMTEIGEIATTNTPTTEQSYVQLVSDGATGTKTATAPTSGKNVGQNIVLFASGPITITPTPLIITFSAQPPPDPIAMEAPVMIMDFLVVTPTITQQMPSGVAGSRTLLGVGG